MQYRFLFIIILVLCFGFSSVSAQSPKTINGGVINGKAISLPKPEYPEEAQLAKISGTVNIQVTIDEQGNVFSALAVSGNPLLREAAEQAAWQAKFSPTRLSGHPVKVTGVIVYTFVAPDDDSFKDKIDKGEKVKILGLGMVLYTLNKIGDEPNLESSANDSTYSFESLTTQLKPLKSLQGHSSEEKRVITGNVIEKVKTRLNGSELWQFEMGEQLSFIAYQMYKYKENGIKGKVDKDEIQSCLLRIREMTYSAPQELPADFLDGIKKIADIADRTDLSGEETLTFLAVKMSHLFDLIIPQ